IAGLLWFLSYAIYMFVQNQYDTFSLAQKMLICLASNSAMAYGFQIILMWEGTGKGLGWSDMFNPVNPDDTFTFGHVIIMLLLDAIIYMLIALYVEAVFPGDYGVPLEWYYPFTRSYWFGNKVHADATPLTNLESEIYEKEPSNLKIGIQISKLQKVFPGDKVAVSALSFNMFEGQVTVLLGHNGAGKTTTMSMLTGMITPTSGTATINGYDIRKDMPQIRESLGLCPQHNILFDDLTVAEHLYFYSKLKGLDK
ncbi:ABC transporter ATP-binding protein, partial [Oryctes borbonicus]